MRAGLRAIQQTLTPEAAGVLNDSIAEAGRRNHAQTTPLHVAATLLASPSGFLRQACIRSHPNSSHPLQCRALELCFSVALDRLATAQAQVQTPSEPPVSNALMAALKRAQANQRRGCPDQQQQPLLAVKVELDQLIISILDDPSVSRVMREASFSSPAVKAKIEQSITKSTSHGNPRHQLGMPIFLNPSPAFQLANAREEEIRRALEIMLRLKKRNPILVGDEEPQAVVKDFLKRIENKELVSLMNVEVVSMEKGISLSSKDQIAERMAELGGIIEGMIGNGGVILDLGDLKWLVDQSLVLEMQTVVIMEMSKLLARFRGYEGGKLWFIGTATCETYLRCQDYHSTMETDWDLQAVPVATRSPFPRIFPRHGTEKLWRGPEEPMNSMRTVRMSLQQPLLASHVSDIRDSGQRATLCPQCSKNYEREVLAVEKSFSEATRPSLPTWLQNANLNSNQSQGKENGILSEHKTEELWKKWRDTCLHLHSSYHQTSNCDRSPPSMLSTMGLYNPNMLGHLIFPPKFPAVKPLGQAQQLHTSESACQQTRISNSPTGSPVRTDLVLGRNETESTPEKAVGDQAKDFLSSISRGTMDKLGDNFIDASGNDIYKKLVKGLMEKAWWQEEAVSTVASAITTWKLGNGKRRGTGLRGDIWLLFMGPDRVGKKKMAMVLAEQICGANPVVISLGTHRCTDEIKINSRAKTAIDRLVEAVQRNPFSVIMLEDMDEADNLVRRHIKNAIERGRLADSHGREVSLGNTIYILAGNWSTIHRDEALRGSEFVDEAKIASIASTNCQLGLIVREKSSKRSQSSLLDNDRPLKHRKELRSTLSLDLRLSAADDEEEDNADGSHNSSDVTVDHEDEPNNPVNQQFSITSVAHDLINNVDESIVFKPVSLAFALGKIKKAISLRFSSMRDENLSLEVEDKVLEMILGGVWHDLTSLDEWICNVLEPSFHQLKPQPQQQSGERIGSVVRLVVMPDSGSRGVKSKDDKGDWLPSSILV